MLDLTAALYLNGDSQLCLSNCSTRTMREHAIYECDLVLDFPSLYALALPPECELVGHVPRAGRVRCESIPRALASLAGRRRIIGDARAQAGLAPPAFPAPAPRPDARSIAAHEARDAGRGPSAVRASKPV